MNTLFVILATLLPIFNSEIAVENENVAAPEVVKESDSRIADPIKVRVAIVIEDLIVPGTNGKRMHEVCGLNAPGGYNINGGYWHDPHVQYKEFKRDLEASSHGVLQYEIVDIQQAERLFTYDKISNPEDEKKYMTIDTLLQRFATRRVDNLTSYDYVGMMKHYGYDKMVDAGELDEIWVYSFPASGMWESQMIGDGAFWCNSPGLGKEQGAPCDNLCIVMCCNYERSTDLALHAYGHRLESIMWHVYGSWKIREKDKLKEVNNWEKFAAYAGDYDHLESNHAHIGNIHFPANGVKDYDYDNTSYVYTYADSWYDYPDVKLKNPRKINSSEWEHPGGGQWGYMLWFYEHIPHFKGLNSKDGHLNNWWHYVVKYNEAIRLEEELRQNKK